MLVLLLLAVAAWAQAPSVEVKKEPVANCAVDESGNYVAVSHAAVKAEPTPTKQTYTDAKGKVYPVWLNSKGKPFILRVSRNTGVEYRYYLVTEGGGKPIVQ